MGPLLLLNPLLQGEPRACLGKKAFTSLETVLWEHADFLGVEGIIWLFWEEDEASTPGSGDYGQEMSRVWKPSFAMSSSIPELFFYWALESMSL